MAIRLIAATRNPAKVAELARLVAGLANVRPLPADLGGTTAPEAGDSFAAIAAAKAVSWSSRIGGEWIVATDGGLVIPALGDRWSPLRTRRFIGEAATDFARAEALLALAADLVGKARRIVWREALAIARDGEVCGLWEREGPPGMLAKDYDPALIAAGHGFWVPALWVCPECGGRRLAELSEEEQAARADHWSQLGAALRNFLLANAKTEGADGESERDSSTSSE